MLLALVLVLSWIGYQTSGSAKVTANSLRLSSQSVALHPVVELDGMSRAEVHALRAQQVAAHKALVEGDYQPSHAVFGRIEDGRPWWGMEGQFCHGPGPRSADGLSEESRFISNPFLLLALGEAQSFIGVEPCVVAHPWPDALAYEEDRVVVRYDLSAFARQVATAGREQAPHLFLHNYNARDWGYQWVSVLSSSNVSPAPKSELFAKAIQMRAYIHTGNSCRQQGGCNNGSPREPDLYIAVDALPARLELGLHKHKPQGGEPPDLRYVIEMR